MDYETYLQIVESAVPPLYLLFAIQVAVRTYALRGVVDWRRALALWWLVAVFILCALAGYLSHALNWSEEVRFWLHAFLIVATSGLVVSNSAQVLADMLRRHE